eukprot:146310_1
MGARSSFISSKCYTIKVVEPDQCPNGAFLEQNTMVVPSDGVEGSNIKAYMHKFHPVHFTRDFGANHSYLISAIQFKGGDLADSNTVQTGDKIDVIFEKRTEGYYGYVFCCCCCCCSCCRTPKYKDGEYTGVFKEGNGCICP